MPPILPPTPAPAPRSPPPPRPAREARVSLVIPTWEGSAAWLPDCLEAVKALRPAPHVIVVFDGPAEACVKATRRALPGARHLPLRTRRGFAVAASAGLRAARGTLVALLNDDAVPAPDWLAELEDAASRHPDVGSFASRVLSAEEPDRIDSAGHGLTRWGEPFAIGHGASDGPPFHEERAVFGAPACAAVYRWELLRDCGAFDAAFEAYLEDVDLSLRAQLMGFPCLYVPSAVVSHQGSASYGWGRGDGRAERLVARNRIRLLLKSMPRNALRQAVGPAATSVLAELAWRSLPGNGPVRPLAGGLLDGLRGAREALGARGAALGGRRVDDASIRRVLKESEQHLIDRDGSQGQRLRAALSRGLARWMDRTEHTRTRPPWPEGAPEFAGET